MPAHLWESLWAEGEKGKDNEDFLSYSRWWSKVTDDQLVEADSILPVVWPQANATEGIAPPRPAASPSAACPSRRSARCSSGRGCGAVGAR